MTALRRQKKQPQNSKITYTSASGDLDRFQRQFDEALTKISTLYGREHPLGIDNQSIFSNHPPILDVSPIDASIMLGKFSSAGAPEVDRAIQSSKIAQKTWGETPWTERIKILRKASALIRERKFEIAAIMSVEVGKNRLESMGDAEESADLIDYYCEQMELARGFARPMGKLLPNEKTLSVLRPYGVFICIAPFNFPMALSTGMSSAALIAGNAVVYKPSPEAPWTGLKLHEIYRDAGLPSGLFQFLPGDDAAGESMWRHPGADGIVFTGSKEVGLKMAREFSASWLKPVLLELGGKNPAIVCESADLEMAAEGVMKSAFGLQGQKCSACSRVYVHQAVADDFLDLLISKTKAFSIGNPSHRDVYFGPVIDRQAVDRFLRAAKSAKTGGKILYGGSVLQGPSFDRGNFVAPTIVELPLGHELFQKELFLPFLSIARVRDLDQAIAESNKSEYGLTAGIFSKTREEIEKFFDAIESGVCYANRKTGATTGAWPGVQSFCGWKASGSTGKGGCGPYYVAQFMREQSRTLME